MILNDLYKLRHVLFLTNTVYVALGQTPNLNTFDKQESIINNNRRVIVTTDIGGTDPDDQQSMVHLLLCSNDIDIEAIICQMAFVKSEIGTEAVSAIIDSYAKVEDNLRLHDRRYPTSDYLRSITKGGQTEVGMAGVGDGKSTDGSELIIKCVDKNDPRSIWLTAWGWNEYDSTSVMDSKGDPE